MMRLAGKVALITGTAQGQGRAAAVRFAAEGASIVGCDLRAESNAETVDLVRSTGGEMTGMGPVDLGDSRAAREWVAQAAHLHGRVDVLFNNAAAPRFRLFAELTEEDWSATLRNELDLVFHVTQAAWPHLAASQGVVINTASIQAHVGIAENGGGAHAAAKGGVLSLTRQLAAEGAAVGIRVNSISPGTVETPSTRALANDPARRQRITSRLPVARLATPEDIVGIAVLLACEESAYMTGADVIVDGGMTAV